MSSSRGEVFESELQVPAPLKCGTGLCRSRSGPITVVAQVAKIHQ